MKNRLNPRAHLCLAIASALACASCATAQTGESAVQAANPAPPAASPSPTPTFVFRTIVPAPASGASVAELGQAAAAGLNAACLNTQQQMVAVLHAPDSFDPQTGIYAISATLGLLPPFSGPLPWPEDSYAVTRALAGLDAAARKKMALDTVELTAKLLCRTIATQGAASAKKKP